MQTIRRNKESNCMSLTPTPNYPTYPPYHQGLYLEDYFIDFLENSNIQTSRKFIKVGWTSYYNNGCDTQKLIKHLDSLCKDDKYFVVCQHDDAPREILPPDTIIFSAGGNFQNKNVIPIPLICSSISNPPTVNLKNKDIFCSFVGSNTNPIRAKLFHSYSNNTKYLFHQKNWSPKISGEDLNVFLDLTSRSRFSLCPRGYGPSSFRLYEVMQLKSVPVYISDRHYLPWIDDIDWNDICVLIRKNEIDIMDDILNSIDDEQYANMLNNIDQIYNNYFTLDSVCKKIIRKVNDETDRTL